MPHKPGEPLPESAAELHGLTKAAVLLLAVGPERASHILKTLPPEQIEEVTRELAGLGTVPDPLRTEVVEEFYGISLASASFDCVNAPSTAASRVNVAYTLDRRPVRMAR